MADISWIQSVLYEPPTVLGRRLRPFSPLHALILQNIDSPFMFGGTAATFEDLVVAVHVCGLTWTERNQWLPPAKLLRRWGRKQRHTDFGAVADVMDEYISESWQLPERWTSGKGPSHSKANGAFHLAVFGMSRLGMTEARAWDCPVARLICYREAFAEQETGKSDLVSDQEKRGIEALKKHGS